MYNKVWHCRCDNWSFRRGKQPVIKSADMPEEMQQAAIQVATEAMQNNDVEKDVSLIAFLAARSVWSFPTQFILSIRPPMLLHSVIHHHDL